MQKDRKNKYKARDYKMENIKTLERITQTKSWFFCKTDEGKMREDTNISTLRNEMRYHYTCQTH